MKKAFTLIEMLIVIVIIGILAAALVPRLQDVQGRARDTKRKADITQLTNAISLYKLDSGKYPKANGATGNTYASSYYGSSWFTELTGLMNSLPLDPKNNQSYAIWDTGTYVYMYGNIFKQEQTYVLFAKLENERDPDRCEVQDYTFFVHTSIRNTCNFGSPGGCRRGVECGQYYQRSDVGP